MNKYKKTIDRINSKELTRSELASLKENAKTKFLQGDLDAEVVLIAIEQAIPKDEYTVFMGFCPNAELANRLDTEWREKGICTFQHHDSEHQVERFNNIRTGDLIVLKKRQEFGKTMRLYGHGRVTRIENTPDGERILIVNWAATDVEFIEVPLMGCNSTIDLKYSDQISQEMPEKYFQWLAA